MTHDRDGYQGGVQKYDFSLKSISRGLVLLLTPLIAYTLGLFPLLWSFLFVLGYLNLGNILHILIFSGFLVILFFLFIIIETVIPGLFIRVFRIRVEEGAYDLSIKDKGFYRHLLFFILYRPSLSLVGIIPLVPVRLLFLKLVGLQIGKGSLVAGTELIDEPFAVTIGDHTLIGGYVMIYTHLSFKKMINKKVRIGNNCFIGNKAVIFPGVIIEDDVIVQPGSVVQSDQVLEKGYVYQGNPATKV